jgi:hypothetical protein
MAQATRVLQIRVVSIHTRTHSNGPPTMGVARHQQNSPGIYVTQLDMHEGKS